MPHYSTTDLLFGKAPECTVLYIAAQPHFSKSMLNVVTVSDVTFVVCEMFKPHEEFMRKILLNCVMTPHCLFNHTNCLEQGTFRHTYGNLNLGIRLHLNRPPFICSLSSGLKVCMGNAQATMS